MKFFLIPLFMLLSLVIPTGVVNAKASSESNNGWSSSGGDDVPFSVGGAWFLGDAPVYYCVEKAPDFSVSEAEVIKLVDQAVTTWKAYYDKNKAKLNSASSPINFNFKSIGCNGNEDLKVYLGVESEEISKQKTPFYNPFGFAILKNYNLETNRGKGYIWLADPKKAYPESHQMSFYGMILHELGHVFGNAHRDFTIMSEKLPQTISYSTPDGGYIKDDPSLAKLFSQIDGKRALFFDHASLWSYEGVMSSPDVARMLTGRQFQGSIKAIFSNQGPYVNYNLKLCDNGTCTSVPVIQSGQGTIETNTASVFKTVTKQGIEASYSKGFEVTGTITASNGAKYTVLITLNLGDISPVRLRLIHNGGLIDLFTLVPVGQR